MKVGWEVKTLGEVCEFFNDGNWIESKDQSENGYRLIQTGNVGIGEFKNKSGKERYISEETFIRLKCTEILEGDILISRLPDPVGRSCLLPNIGEKMITAVDCSIVRLKRQIITPDYFRYYSQSAIYFNYIGENITGTTRDRISRKNLGTVSIPIPPLPEQQRIVAILDEAFAAIAKAKANAEQNLKNANELFESYLQAVFENRGEGWEEKTLSELFDVKHGFAFLGEFFSDGGDYVLLTPGNFYEKGGYRDRGDKQKYYIGNIPPDFILKEGDLLVAMTEQAAGLLGSPIIVPESNKFLHNQRLGLIKPKSDIQFDNEFFYHIFNLKHVRKSLHDSGTGVKVRHTSPTKIGQVIICYPKSKTEQQTIVQKLDALSAETQKLAAIYQKKLVDLEELKKSILQKAFKGEMSEPLIFADGND